MTTAAGSPAASALPTKLPPMRVPTAAPVAAATPFRKARRENVDVGASGQYVRKPAAVSTDAQA
jgi:hypothetical protein